MVPKDVLLKNISSVQSLFIKVTYILSSVKKVSIRTTQSVIQLHCCYSEAVARKLFLTYDRGAHERDINCSFEGEVGGASSGLPLKLPRFSQRR